jgi:hypothetical protein
MIFVCDLILLIFVLNNKIYKFSNILLLTIVFIILITVLDYLTVLRPIFTLSYKKSHHNIDEESQNIQQLNEFERSAVK